MLPEPEVKVKDIKDSLQVHKVRNDSGCGQGPTSLATQPVQGQWFIATELTGKLQKKRKKKTLIDSQTGYNAKEAVQLSGYVT